MTTRTVAMALALAGLLDSGAQEHKFRSGVDVVRVDALVTSGRRVLTGLNPSDFELRDNGIVQTIGDMALESLPLTITLVLDTSGSVAGGKMRSLASAVDLILNGLRGPDRVALVTFSHRVWQRIPLTSDIEQVRRVLTAAGAEGGTSLNDAVYTGLALSESQESRALVLVFSDGLDNASWMSDAIVERAARRADAVVYGVAVGASATNVFANPTGNRTTTRPAYLPRQTAFLDSIASATGGRVIKSDTTKDLPEAFEEILEEFRTRYLITYSPRGVDAPGWHTIDVKVKGRHADVKARRGYERGPGR